MSYPGSGYQGDPSAGAMGGYWGPGVQGAQLWYGNSGAYMDPESDQVKGLLAGEYGQTMGRAAPDMTAAQLGPVSTVSTPTLGPTATAGMLDTGASDAIKGGYQMPLLDQLLAQSQGKGPSLASEQLKAGMDQNMASQMAMAGSNTGVANSALGARTLAMQGGAAGQQLAQQSALARMQEQATARGQLGQMAGAVRGQDLDVAAQNAQLGQFNAGQQNQMSQFGANIGLQAGLANQGAYNQFRLQQGQFDQDAASQNLKSKLATMGMNDQQINQIMQQYMQQNQSDLSARMQYEDMMARQSAARLGVTEQGREYNQSRSDNQMDKYMQMAGTAAMIMAA